MSVALRHALLHRNRTGDRCNDTRELDEQAVTGDLADAAFVLDDQWVDQLAAQRLEARQRARLASPISRL